jgi:hypothetical protein
MWPSTQKCQSFLLSERSSIQQDFFFGLTESMEGSAPLPAYRRSRCSFALARFKQIVRLRPHSSIMPEQGQMPSQLKFH